MINAAGTKRPSLRAAHAVRRGATVVEVAMVAPLTFLLLIGLVVGGIGVFRYQQVASLAREGARWASVRGKNYQKLFNLPIPMTSDVLNNAVLPLAAGLDKNQLTSTLVRDAANTTVTFTVTYQWLPEAYLTPITFTSTSVMPISH